MVYQPYRPSTTVEISGAVLEAIMAKISDLSSAIDRLADVAANVRSAASSAQSTGAVQADDPQVQQLVDRVNSITGDLSDALAKFQASAPAGNTTSAPPANPAPAPADQSAQTPPTSG